ncbi:MAG TPA: NAD-dependent epimerase/dehydratase family protein [Gemmatimonadales bacterium]|nr:NAD-dependent epimerase/dehydratase family protein [Gemmatimonadales bacterium]
MSGTSDRSVTLVTGATGFTGGHLVRSLADDGETVRVIARSATEASQKLPPGVEIVEGDVADRETVERAVAGVRTIYHLAAVYREAKHRDDQYARVHVDATGRLLDAARRRGVERFVHCSTVGVHGHITSPPADEQAPYGPGDVYQRTKLEGEQLALSYHDPHGLSITVARPTAIYGPGDTRLLKLFRMIARRRFIVLGSGEIFYHMVHVYDLVRGLRLLGTDPRAPGEVFILGGERYHTLREVASLIAEAVGVSQSWLRLPAKPFQIAGTLCEKACIPFGIEPPLHRRRVDFYTKSRAFTIEKAQRMLDYSPRVSLKEGVNSTLQWYRKYGYLFTFLAAAA